MSIINFFPAEIYYNKYQGMMIASGKYLLMADADGATLIDDLANVYA